MPRLETFDRFGNRHDAVQFHPAYHELMELGCLGLRPRSVVLFLLLSFVWMVCMWIKHDKTGLGMLGDVYGC